MVRPLLTFAVLAGLTASGCQDGPRQASDASLEATSDASLEATSDAPEETTTLTSFDTQDTTADLLETTDTHPQDVPIELPPTTTTTASLPFSDGTFALTTLVAPPTPIAYEADFIDRLRILLATTYGADVPVIPATNAAPPAGALVLGNAHTSPALANLATTHQALVDHSFPGAAGFVIERHADTLVVGFNDAAGADAALARLSAFAAAARYANAYATPGVTLGDPRWLDSESDAFASPAYVAAHPRDMWYAERLRDVAALLASQRFGDDPASHGALMPAYSVDGIPGSSGCSHEVHGRAIEGLSAIAWAYASAIPAIEDPTFGTITINPYAGNAALQLRAVAAMLFADRHLRLPDGRFARIAGGPGCTHYDTDTASVAFIGMEMIYAYHLLAPTLDTYTRQWFLDLITTSLSQAISLGSEYSSAFVNQDVALSYAVALYAHVTGSATIVRKGSEIAVADYLATRSARIAANRPPLGFLSEVGDFDVGYDLVSQQQLAFYLAVRPDDTIAAQVFADHMNFSMLVYQPLHGDGVTIHVNGYWRSPRHPERGGGVFDGFAALGFHWTHLLTTAFTPFPKALLDAYADEARANVIFGTTIAATPSLASQTTEARYGCQTGWFQPLYFKTFMEPLTREIPAFGTLVGDYPILARGSFIERDAELGFTAVNRPKYYVYSLDGVIGLFWWGLDTEHVAYASASSANHLATYLDGTEVTFASASSTMNELGARPAETFTDDARAEVTRTHRFFDDRLEIVVRVKNTTPAALDVVEQIPFFRATKAGDPVLHTDASVTDGTTRMRIGADGHGLWVGTADAGAAAFHADPGEAVPLISTLASLVQPKAQRLRIAFGTVEPGATATFTYALTPD